MAEFRRQQVEMFLGVVRKYMQVRGPMSQKDLAVLTEVGVSTMSRFLNQKTTELNAQLICKIVAKLNIPLHEIIDFVDESYTERFIRLVKFYKEEHLEGIEEESESGDELPERRKFGRRESDQKAHVKDDLLEGFGPLEMGKKDDGPEAKKGPSKEDGSLFNSEFSKRSKMSIREKLESLSPRQKAYLNDFLNLDMESRDLMVDIGNSLFRYFKQKGMDF